MKVLSGSILMGFSLLSLTLSNISFDIWEGGFTRGRPDFQIQSNVGLGGLAIILLILGLSLMVWELISILRTKQTKSS
jgi:hypothetical protein